MMLKMLVAVMSTSAVSAAKSCKLLDGGLAPHGFEWCSEGNTLNSVNTVACDNGRILVTVPGSCSFPTCPEGYGNLCARTWPPKCGPCRKNPTSQGPGAMEVNLEDVPEHVRPQLENLLPHLQQLQSMDQSALEVFQPFLQLVQPLVDQLQPLMDQLKPLLDQPVPDMKRIQPLLAKVQPLVEQIQQTLEEHITPHLDQSSLVAPMESSPEEILSGLGLDLSQLARLQPLLQENLEQLPQPTAEDFQPLITVLQPLVDQIQPLMDLLKPLLEQPVLNMELIQPLLETVQPLMEQIQQTLAELITPHLDQSSLVAPMESSPEKILSGLGLDFDQLAKLQPTAEDFQPLVAVLQPLVDQIQPIMDLLKPLLHQPVLNMELIQPLLETVQPLVDQIQPLLEAHVNIPELVAPILNNPTPSAEEVLAELEPVLKDIQTFLEDPAQQPALKQLQDKVQLAGALPSFGDSVPNLEVILSELGLENPENVDSIFKALVDLQSEEKGGEFEHGCPILTCLAAFEHADGCGLGVDYTEADYMKVVGKMPPQCLACEKGVMSEFACPTRPAALGAMSWCTLLPDPFCLTPCCKQKQ